MAEPYLLVAYWDETAPDYDVLIHRIIGSIETIDATVHLTSASGTKVFPEVRAAGEALCASSASISAFAIELAGGASIATSSWGHSGRMIELDVRGSEEFEARSSAKSSEAYAAMQIVAAAIIEQAGAKFAWMTRIPGDIDGVSEAIAAFDKILSQGNTEAIPLDEMSHVGWLFVWPSHPSPPMVRTAEKVQSAIGINYVDLVRDRPIDLVPGWVKIES
jgi:hypothetical protein